MSITDIGVGGIERANHSINRLILGYAAIAERYICWGAVVRVVDSYLNVVHRCSLITTIITFYSRDNDTKTRIVDIRRVPAQPPKVS